MQTSCVCVDAELLNDAVVVQDFSHSVRRYWLAETEVDQSPVGYPVRDVSCHLTQLGLVSPLC